MALVGLEGDQRPRNGIDRFAASLDANRAVDDDQEDVLFHLMLAEPLARLEADQDRTPFVV